MDVLRELLQLYSQRPKDEIETGGELLLRQFKVRTIDELLAIEGYKTAFALVSDCAATVAAIAEKSADPAGQMRASIRLIRQMIDDGCQPEKIEVTRKLVEARLWPTWPSAVQKDYTAKSEIFEWRDFFVSYTNRDAPATNNQFRQLIRTCLGKTPSGAENAHNYLARVITRHLRRYQGLSGFFDEDALKVGENIQEEVDYYCRHAFALVQLIEPLALEREPPCNWCFHEYTEFTGNPNLAAISGSQRRHFFVLTGADLSAVSPANLATTYKPWVDRIGGLKYIALQDERNTSLRAKLQLVAKEILRLRSGLVDAWINA